MAASTKSEFKTLVREWATKLDVEISWLGIRDMSTKWASCSTNGHLNFSKEVLSLPRDLQDYVIVHELLHIRVPNHGRLWKSLMQAHLSGWEDLEADLKATNRGAE